MDSTVTLDSAGRILIPKTVREELHLQPGDTMDLVAEAEQVTLRPVRAVSPLRKKQGIWVFRTGQKLSAASTDQTLREIQEQRVHEILGKSR